MVILKLKKELMQVVKSFTFMCLFCLIAAQGKSQTLSGNFVSSDSPLYEEFIFKKNQTFSSKSMNAFGHTTSYMEGYYLFREDTLIIICDESHHPKPSSKFHIVEQTNKSKDPLGQIKEISENKFYIELLIRDMDDQPIKGATIAYMNGKNIVFAELSDEDGKSLMISEGRFIESILISFVGYKELNINVNSLWGYRSVVKVQLDHANEIEYVTSCLDKYLVKKNTKSELYLIKLDDTNRQLSLRKK